MFERVNDDFCDCADGSDEPGGKPSRDLQKQHWAVYSACLTYVHSSATA